MYQWQCQILQPLYSAQLAQCQWAKLYCTTYVDCRYICINYRQCKSVSNTSAFHHMFVITLFSNKAFQREGFIRRNKLIEDFSKGNKSVHLCLGFHLIICQIPTLNIATVQCVYLLCRDLQFWHLWRLVNKRPNIWWRDHVFKHPFNKMSHWKLISVKVLGAVYKKKAHYCIRIYKNQCTMIRER